MEANHPIPQQISSYQFRLVGDMTLKQFFQLAGGVLAGLLFYAAPLHPLIKWPLVIFFCLLGAALAFLPFEERPLEKWIIAFFRSVYSPTIFSWKPSTATKFFQDEAVQAPAQQVISPGGEAALNAYLATPNAPSSFFSKLEDGEKKFLAKMGDLFAPGSPKTGEVKMNAVPAQVQTPVTASPVSPAVSPMAPIISQENKPPVSEGPVVAPTVKPTLKIPTTAPVAVEVADPTKPRFVVEERTPEAASQIKEEQVQAQAPQVSEGPRQNAVFSPDAAPPSPPTIPNTVSGQVMDANGKIITGAILEIRDVSGRPVRALRSNMLGHFLIVTALVNGAYEIVTEKDGYEFDITKFEVNGGILDPIAIRARAKAPAVSPASTEFTSSQALQI